MTGDYAAERDEVDMGGGLICGYPLLRSPTHGGGRTPPSQTPPLLTVTSGRCHAGHRGTLSLEVLCLRPCLVRKFFFQNSPSHRIFGRMHGALNIDENIN
jgi:hypothetical protein